MMLHKVNHKVNHLHLMALTYVKAENSDWLLSKHKQLLFVTADLLYLTLLIFLYAHDEYQFSVVYSVVYSSCARTINRLFLMFAAF